MAEWSALGCAESARGEYAAAATAFRAALRIKPNWYEAKHNLAGALFELGRMDEAVALYREAAGGRRPELPLRALATMIPGHAASDHLAILEARRAWAERYLPAARRGRFDPAGASQRARLRTKLRIGYLNSFFHHDNYMKPVWGLINQHDRERFDIHLFSDAPRSAVGRAYRAQPGDTFHDISDLSNAAAADEIERAEIDILVDFNAYSKIGRLPLVALKPAPVLVGWSNMYATSGIAAYDYLIGDAVVIPPDEEPFYSERIVRVAGSYLTFEVAYPVPPVAPAPESSNGTITFGCLAPQYKITGPVIAAWCRILQDVPGSRLVLQNTALFSGATRAFVHGEFAAHGIAPERVVLHGPADHYRFLQTYDEIDVVLDTFPYNGGTTTMEALWQGVPVVTFWGDRWISRTTASLLIAADLARFVGEDLTAYVSLAVDLGRRHEAGNELAELRLGMRDQLGASAVCDVAGFARNMERLYLQMWEPGGSLADDARA